jgi:hypothetical protein
MYWELVGGYSLLHRGGGICLQKHIVQKWMELCRQAEQELNPEKSRPARASPCARSTRHGCTIANHVANRQNDSTLLILAKAASEA